MTALICGKLKGASRTAADTRIDFAVLPAACLKTLYCRRATLSGFSYRRQLWTHRPLTDFWRVGKGYAKKLEAIGIYTMGDVARCSIGKAGDYYNEALL